LVLLMKKIINKPDSLVNEMCNGIIAAHPHLAYNPKYKIIQKKVIDKNKVTLISGGGSGHEPAHAGFVGHGMLDAAVCGDVFASPSQIQVYQAIKDTASDAGSLLIIKNYSGDVMNFKNAANMAVEDGIKVDYVIVDDDIAVEDSLYTVGRRGVAGTVFVHKIAGAAAAQGKSLAEVKEIAGKVNANVKSIGFALTSCTVPAKGTPTFELSDSEIEYGVGIHGEPGIKRQPMQTADELAKSAIKSLIKECGLEGGCEITMMINGFGATPLMELYLLNNAATRELAQEDIKVSRTFVGNYMTSIDMAGASITVLKLDAELKGYLSADCLTPGFVVQGPEDNNPYEPQGFEAAANGIYIIETDPAHASIQGNTLTLDNIVYIIDCLAANIIKNESYFCELDSVAGDGDFGTSIAKGFGQLKNEWQDILQNSKTIGGFLDAASLVIMEQCGGASGPIWGSAFRAAGKAADGKASLNVTDFAQMLQGAVKAIQITGERSFGRGAAVGDKTLIDALMPCADAWADCAAQNAGFAVAFEKGAAAAVAGAEKTKEIVARMGRAGTVGERSLGHPDAGAYALGVLFTEIAKALKYS
jgi:dihydroxyacetone kinase